MYPFLPRCFYSCFLEYFYKPSSYWTAYYVDIFVFVYAFSRQLYITYQLKLIKENSIVNLQTADPGLHFLSQFDLLVIIILFIFNLYYIYIDIVIANVDVHLSVFSFWRQIVVELQDNYFKCLLNERKLKQVQEKKAAKLKQKYPIYNSFLLLKWILKLSARLLVWVKLENLNLIQFDTLIKQQKNQKISQINLPTALQNRVVLIMLIFDKIAYAFQIISGKKIQNKPFNFFNYEF